MARRPLSPAARAAIAEGLRRYYMSRGMTGAKTGAIRGAARRHAEVRGAERAQARQSTSPRGQRGAANTRRDRAVRSVGTLADLRAQRIRQQQRRNAPPPRRTPPRPPAGQRRQPPPRAGS